MQLKLSKLDKRNTGYGTWKFYVELKLLDKNYVVDLCNVR